MLAINRVNALEITIIVNNEDVMSKLSDLQKAQTKVFAEIQDLKDLLANVDVPLEVNAAVAILEKAVQALDDLNPDASAPTTPTTKAR